MASKINAGDDWRRADMYCVNPYEITIVEDFRGRRKPPKEEAIIKMAESLMDEGQQQPVQCRKIEQNRLQLVLGFTRAAAGRLIRDGFVDSNGNQRKDETFLLQVRVVTCNEEQAFTNNIVENEFRNDTNPMDTAYNQARLRDRYGWSDTEIATLYKYKGTAKVADYARLMTLEAYLQDEVGEGNLSIEAALALLELPPEKRKEAMEASLSAKGKVMATKVKDQVRSHYEKISSEQLADAPDRVTGDPNSDGATSAAAAAAAKGGKEGKGGKGTPATPSSRYVARTLKNVREVLKKIKDECPNASGQNLAKTILEYIEGKKAEMYLINNFTKATGGAANSSPAPKHKTA